MNLYAHQQKLITHSPKRCGIFWGTGGGKTITALMLAEGATLVICPKTLRDDQTWERNRAKSGKDISLTVISKEDLRRDWQKLSAFSTVIVDEAHTCAGAMPAVRYKNRNPVPKTSQLFDALDGYLTKHPPERLYLLTATPIRSPMSVWALGRLLGRTWSFYAFRDSFYVRLPMQGREVWAPRTDTATKERLAKVVHALGSVWKLSDGFDVPEQTYRTMTCPISKEQTNIIRDLPLEYPNPLVLVGKTHQVEQGVSKAEAIEELYIEWGKVLVFARYIQQLDALEQYFKAKHIPVVRMDGSTRYRKAFMEQAEAMTEGIALVQASISSGYELPSFSCVVFASCSWSIVDYEQAQGRVLRANALKKNLYVHLVSGDVDKAVLKALSEKKDFSEHVYAQTRS